VRVAIPSVTSRMGSPVAEYLVERLGWSVPEPYLRLLHFEMETGEVVFCRGSDVPSLVANNVVDYGVTGFDVCVEWSLSAGSGLACLAPPDVVRTSFVSYVGVASRTGVKRIYTEYPALTRAWLSFTKCDENMHLVEMHGSSEGIVQVDPIAAGVILVTSGRTLEANGLDLQVPLMSTDLCFVTSRGRGREEAVGKHTGLVLVPLKNPTFVEKVTERCS
jgi:ATP phosphoribosyltransferase